MSNAQSESYSSQPPSAAPRKVKAGPPLNWISGSIRLLRENWAVILSAYFLVLVVTTLIQFGAMELVSRGGFVAIALAAVVGILVSLVLNAGIMLVFHGAAEKRPRFSDVFSGFNGHTVLSLFLMMIAMALATLVLGFIVYMIMKVTGFSGSMFGSARMGGFTNGGFNPQGAVIMMIFTAVVGFAVLAVYAALFCYVIPLVVVSRQGLLEAMGNSFRASFKNLFVLFFFAVNAVVFMNLVLVPVFAIGVSSVSTIVMGVLALLTSLVWGSVLGGAYYFSFRDVLLAETPSQSDESAESTVPA